MKSLYSQLRKEHLAEWRVWYNMCHNCKNNKTYYVETDVCEEWKGPEGFINWLDDIGPRPNDKYVLDRINKFAEIKIGIPGDDVVVKKTAKSFEEAINTAADAAERILKRRKEKQRP